MTLRPTYIPVKDLTEQDKILTGSVIGPIKVIDDLVVKNINEADQNKYAITLYRLGTIFAHGDTVVRTLLPDDEDNDALV